MEGESRIGNHQMRRGPAGTYFITHNPSSNYRFSSNKRPAPFQALHIRGDMATDRMDSEAPSGEGSLRFLAMPMELCGK